MKRALVLALAAACHASAHAASIPTHLIGIWATAESLYTGTTGQAALHLAEDGLGVLVLASPPARQADGKPRDDAPERVVMALPARVTLDGDTLSVQAFMPGDKERPPPMSCRYDTTGPSLICAGAGTEQAVTPMTRRSASLPADSEAMLARLRTWIASSDGKPSALPPAPATRP